jgi:WD40 repeat protein
VVHRDVKPANILLDQDGNGYLTDFGIATMTGPIRALGGMDELTGSPEYVSPEQVRGEEVTPAADIYSLGVVLYHLLAGEHPFPGTPREKLLEKHLKESLPSVRAFRSELPPAVDEVIQRATAKVPQNRYPTALALVDAFRQATTTGVRVVPARPAGLPIQNPYKGLRPFQEADAADFFGRETLVERLVSRLAEVGGGGRFLAVVGPSGSGKSSVVKAGLIPALRRGALPGSENWFIVEMAPGAHPLEELESGLLRIAVNPPPSLLEQLCEDERGLVRAVKRALPDDESELLLVVDQFEELFTLAKDEAERAQFLERLLVGVTDPRSRLRVVVTLRADFYDRPLQYAGIGDLVSQRTKVVLPLSAAELERAIAGPAERVDVPLEPGLVAAIVADVSEQPGALPLLQYALTELFEHREGDTLALEAYRASGGVRGALARRAEALYAGLDPAGQELGRQLFLRLVTLGEGVEDTRRRVLRTELMSSGGDPKTMEEVIDAFGRHRLLTFDHDPETRAPTVEVAHEALLREWRRLREWIDASREHLRTHHRLAAAATEWVHADKDAGFLLRGSRLDQFETWAVETDLALSQMEQDYLEASLAERQARQTAEAARQAREKALEHRSRNFLRALVGILTIATVVALGLTGFAFNQRREALEAYSLSLAANAQHALSVKDTGSALVLALAANRIDQPPVESQRTLMDAAFAPGPRRRFEAADVAEGTVGPALSVAISPDGRTALAGLDDGAVILWELETGAEIYRFIEHTAGVNDVAFSPDGKTALSGSTDTTVILWDVTTGRKIRHFSGHSGAVRAVAISPDGLTAISGGLSGDSAADSGELILWDLETGREIRRFEGHTAGVVDAAFSPDGRTVLASSGETDHFLTTGETPEYNLILWDVETGESIRQFEGMDHDATTIAISPGVATAVTGSWDRNVYLWDLKTGEQIHIFEGHTDPVTTLAVSPDGRRAISGSQDDSLILWNIETGEQIVQFKAHDSDVLDVTISPDGRTALSTSRNGTLILWDLFDAAEINRFEGHTAMVFDVAFTPDGKQFLSTSGSADPATVAEDTGIRLWHLETGQEIRRFEGHTDAAVQVAISPDGRTALSASNDQSVRLWDLETGAEIRRFEGHAAIVTGVTFSPDGRTGLSCSVDGTLILWDLQTGEAIHHLTGHTRGIWSVAISPDGRTALSGADDSNLILWDLETGEEIRRFLGHDRAEEASVSGIAYLPDGCTAISGGTDGYLIWWDLETGREIRRFGGHSGIRTRVSISPDGRIAFSSGWDGTLMLWDLETGEMIRRFRDPHTGFVFDSAMSPDGRTGLVGSSGQTIIQWQLAAPSLDELLDWVAANRYVRDLTCGERELYRIEPLCEE